MVVFFRYYLHYDNYVVWPLLGILPPPTLFLALFKTCVFQCAFCSQLFVKNNIFYVFPPPTTLTRKCPKRFFKDEKTEKTKNNERTTKTEEPKKTENAKRSEKSDKTMTKKTIKTKITKKKRLQRLNRLYKD